MNATLNGNITPLGTNVSVAFEIGKTTNYNHLVSVGLFNGNHTLPVSLQLCSSGCSQPILESNTLYHYRLKAVTPSNISVYGDDMTFITPNSIPTVTIGTQIWMKYNLNVGKMIPSTSKQANNGTIEKYCYNNLESNGAIYGGLYSWNEMMKYSTIEGSQGICPDGFRIPTRTDFQTLFNFVGADVGYKLREIGNAHWKYISPSKNGTDIFGFTGLPTGYAYQTSFSSIGSYGYFWSSSRSPEGWAYYRSLSYSAPTFYEYMAYITGNDQSYLPVRCIKCQ